MSIFDDMFSAGTPSPTTQPATGGQAALIESLKADPVLGPMIAKDPSVLQGLLASGVTAQPKTLEELLVGTAMDVTGRYGLTGQDRLATSLPPWATGLSGEVLKNVNFDPYLGIVNAGGDERVYMHEKNYPVDSLATPTNSVQPSGDGVDFRSGGGAVTVAGTTPGDKTLSSTQAQNIPYSWDEKQVAEAMKKMRKAGFNVTSFDTGENSLISVWGGMVQRAAMTYAISEGDRKVTPWDTLDLYKSEFKQSGNYHNYESGTSSITRRNVSDLTEGEAFASLQSNLSQMLGRDPSDQETRDFTYRMNQLAAQNPSISKTIAHYKNGEVVSENTHTTGGFTADDAAKAAYDQAQSNPDYAEYQSATTYLNAALSALGPIGG